MAIPKAYFNYIPQPANFLQVVFKDISTNVPTSWLWDFGDGQTSTSQNPTNTYAANGFYTVTFTATNGDGSDQTIINIGVSSAGLVLPQSIQALIDDYVPQGVTIDPIIKNDSIRKWQLYLQPLVCPAVSADDTYDEFAYIPLANQLVAKLVAFDIIVNGASAYLMSLGPQNGQTGRETKKIVTGPTEAEWFSNSDVWSSVMGEGGAFDTLKNECCTLASRLRIYLPFCDPLTYSPIIPMKHCPPPPAPSADPFGIN